MIVVAIIAVLAIVVVPSFMKESKRSKAKSEVILSDGDEGLETGARK